MNRKKIICVSLVILIAISSLIFGVGIIGVNEKQKDDASVCSDGVCEVPTEDENGNQIYAISSPVGYHNVEMIKQAERLDTLDGKKIALVGGSFNADITHMESDNIIVFNVKLNMF